MGWQGEVYEIVGCGDYRCNFNEHFGSYPGANNYSCASYYSGSNNNPGTNPGTNHHSGTNPGANYHSGSGHYTSGMSTVVQEARRAMDGQMHMERGV